MFIAFDLCFRHQLPHMPLTTRQTPSAMPKINLTLSVAESGVDNSIIALYFIRYPPAYRP